MRKPAKRPLATVAPTVAQPLNSFPELPSPLDEGCATAPASAATVAPIVRETASVPTVGTIATVGTPEIGLTRERLLKLEEVLKIVGASRASIYAWIKQGLFPRPLRIGRRRSVWLASEIQDWIHSRARGASSSEEVQNGQ